MNICSTSLGVSGTFLARISGEVRGNVILRKQQYRLSDQEEESNRIAKNMIFGKVYNAKWVLERATRDYTMRIDVEKIKKVTNMLNTSMKAIRMNIHHSCGSR